MTLTHILLFSFALLTDIHVSNSNPQPLEDLQRSVEDINATPDIDFVIVSGDLTESGDRQALNIVKAELDKLTVPYYATSGNHETTWSESAVMDFARVFGSNRFAFTHDSIFFIGFNSGPVIRMADGHVAPQDIAWLRQQLDSIATFTHHNSIVITHYQRLLDYIVPDYVHVLYKGRIVKSAGKELALELEEKGYDWIKKELGE